MKFIMGFIAGVAVGGFLATTTTDQQRAQASAAASRATRKVQESKVGRAVANNAGQVSNAAADRVVDAVDTAGGTITEAIESNDDGQ